MKKLIGFVARHFIVSFLTTMLTLMALVGSAYGFSSIAKVTSIGSSIPQVKTVKELNQEELKKQTPTPTVTAKKSNFVIPKVVPSSIPTQAISPIEKESIETKTTTTVTPSFERDNDTEDVHEDEKQEVHIEREEDSKNNK